MKLISLTRVTMAVAAVTLSCMVGWAEEKPAAQPGKQKVSLSVFDPAVQAAAPGIEKAITLSEEQRKRLESIYNEVFGSDAVTRARQVLQDEESLRPARQEATETLQSAQDWFRKRCAAEVFTPQENELIKKVYAAYNDVRQEVLRDLAARVAEAFSKRLTGILTPEQKAALDKGRVELSQPPAQPAQPEKPAK